MKLEYLKSKLHYNPDSGDFTSIKTGKVVGWISDGRYRIISVDGKRYPAHRLAWFYVTGKQPKEQIDHKDQNKQYNRFENLREATASENRCNVSMRSSNKSGFKGVSFDEKRNKWRSHICVNRKIRYLGLYDTPELASKAYKKAAIVLHKEFCPFI